VDRRGDGCVGRGAAHWGCTGAHAALRFGGWGRPKSNPTLDPQQPFTKASRLRCCAVARWTRWCACRATRMTGAHAAAGWGGGGGVGARQQRERSTTPAFHEQRGVGLVDKGKASRSPPWVHLRGWQATALCTDPITRPLAPPTRFQRNSHDQSSLKTDTPSPGSSPSRWWPGLRRRSSPPGGSSPRCRQTWRWGLGLRRRWGGVLGWGGGGEGGVSILLGFGFLVDAPIRKKATQWHHTPDRDKSLTPNRCWLLSRRWRPMSSACCSSGWAARCARGFGRSGG